MKNEPFCEALKMFLYPGFTRSCFVQLGRDLFLNVVNSGFLARFGKLHYENLPCGGMYFFFKI